VDCHVAPYGQIAQSLLRTGLPFEESILDFLVVWSRPEAVLKSFAHAQLGSPVGLETIRTDVDHYCEMLLLAKQRARVVFVPTWIVPPLHQGHGMLDLAPEVGPTRLLMQANLRLLEKLDGNSNFVPLNAAKWAELAGEKAFSPRLWYSAKVPFGNDLFKASARDLKAALRGLQGRARKLVILDLDETLWGGVVGDVGWQELVLGGHDSVGEALVDTAQP
jgi:predicted enzyme involved in methoxymalonyl-ACP biosynthesis